MADASIGDAGADVASDASDASRRDGSAEWAEQLDGGLLLGCGVDTNAAIVSVGSVGVQTAILFQKHDAVGNRLWRRANTPTNGARGALAAVTNAAGETFVLGVSSDLSSFDDAGVMNGGFVAKLAPSGVVTWQHSYGVDALLIDVALKSNGNIVMAGRLHASHDFGGGTLSPSGLDDALLVELTTSGDFVRSARFGDTGTQTVQRVSVDPSDAVVITGVFDGSIDFGVGPLVGAAAGTGNYDTYVAKLDSSWAYVAAKQFGARNPDTVPLGIGSDALGNVFVCGRVTDHVDFGGGPLTSAGRDDFYVGKLTAQLAHVWSKRFGDALSQACTALAVDSSGGVALGGAFLGSVDFGGGALDGGTNRPQGIVLRLDATGAFTSQRALYADEVSVERVRRITASDFAIVGTFSGRLPIANRLLTTTDIDGFVARLAP